MNIKKRCAIYVYYDKKGRLQKYALYFIRELKKSVDHVLVVINGDLDFESEKELQDLDIEVVKRSNEGYDFWGYRSGILHLGFDAISKFDELILCNSSVYGPFKPFSSVFEKMDQKDIDFWGLSVWTDEQVAPIHLQSYFLAFRSTVLNSHIFKDYWINLFKPINRDEAIAFLETQLTKFFEEHGFRWDSFLEEKQFSKIFPEALIILGSEAIEWGLPVLKREVFYVNYTHYLAYTNVRTVQKALENLTRFTSYPIDLIYDDLISTKKLSDWSDNAHLNYILPHNVKLTPKCRRKIAVVFFAYFEDLVDLCVKYLSHLPKDSHFFIVSSKQNLNDLYFKKLKNLNFDFVESRIHPNRGRNEAAFFLVCRDVLENFDYICLMHDKKCSHLPKGIFGYSFMLHCCETLLASQEYVENIIATFETNPRLGILFPPFPCFSAWIPFFFNSNRYENNDVFIHQLVETLQIKAPIDPSGDFPVGTMFWLRKGALNALFRHDWTLDDFPEEPLKIDGTILHAMERLYPVLCQESGYYSAKVMPDYYASSLLDNLKFCALHPPIKQTEPSTQLKSLLKTIVKEKLRNLLLYLHLYRPAKFIYIKLKNKRLVI